MNYELFIARRLRLRSKDGRGTPPGIIIAVTGIALSIIIMMVAMCVVLGFKNQIKQKVMGFEAHVSILPAKASEEDSGEFLTFSPELSDIVDSTSVFDEAALSIVQSAIIKTDNDFEGIVIKGLTPGRGMDFIKQHVVEGTLPEGDDNQNGIAISSTTAGALGLGVGDRVFAYFFIDGAVKARRLDITAIYDTHFGDYDRNYIFSTLSMLQKVNGVDSLDGNKIDLYVNDTRYIEDDAYALQAAMIDASYAGELPGAYRLTTVNDTGLMYFNWLELLDTNVVVILILMTLVSGFTLVSSLFIIILDRVNMIGILKALGADNRSIRKIFIYMGQRLVLAGMIAGNVIGLGFLIAQKHLHFIPLDPEAYYLSFVPVEINPWHIVLLNTGVFIIAWAVILIPCHMVSGVKPSQSIRYE